MAFIVLALSELVHVFNIRDNKTDEVELYESDDIQVGCIGFNDIIIRTEILVK